MMVDLHFVNGVWILGFIVIAIILYAGATGGKDGP